MEIMGLVHATLLPTLCLVENSRDFNEDSFFNLNYYYFKFAITGFQYSCSEVK
jgi:hypothetical protein